MNIITNDISIGRVGTKLYRAWQAGITAVLISDPGIGKTAAVSSFANKIGAKLFVFVASHHEPPDINGWTVPDNERKVVSIFLPELISEIIERAKQGLPSVLFLDEIGTAEGLMQAALLRTINERVIAGHPLPRNLLIVAAMNPPDTGVNGHELALPLNNRVWQINVTADNNDFVSNFGPYWSRHEELKDLYPGLDPAVFANARSNIASFIQKNPGFLCKTPDTEDGRTHAYPTPRTWDILSRLYAACDLNLDECSADFVGIVGSEAALQVSAYLKEVNFPGPEEILADPKKLPRRTDMMFACLTNTMTHIQMNISGPKWIAGWRVLDHIMTNFEGGRGYAMIHVKPLFELQVKVPGVTPPMDVLPKFFSLLQQMGLVK